MSSLCCHLYVSPCFLFYFEESSVSMFSVFCFTLPCGILFICVSCVSPATFIHYSYSRDVGGGSGSSFSTEGEGRITAIRVWEIYGAYITGIQLRYDNSWADVVGRIYDTPQEMELFDGEAIDQISGKFDNNYIYQVIFGTSRGRSLIVGQPTQGSFNFYPNHPDAELRLLSGRFNGNGITSLGAHWGVVFTH
ncbi:zymogen granule membrane protein 16 isoform X2 [Oreochromis niloticus]|uniref:zymogen granule membrane protein 16 isoform X2 n=1 Tax=Oreochromis niloticus TaxID=8128 RepID=UPI00090551FC|nr:zymogen granule membrane protein 16 isoform X2 [Oreochromis niloticus]